MTDRNRQFRHDRVYIVRNGNRGNIVEDTMTERFIPQMLQLRDVASATDSVEMYRWAHTAADNLVMWYAEIVGGGLAVWNVVRRKIGPQYHHLPVPLPKPYLVQAHMLLKNEERKAD